MKNWPLYLCLAFKELLESLLSELVLGFLDDVTLGGDAACVMKDFILLEAAAKQHGLELNLNKCEIVGLSDKTRSFFTSDGINLPETSPADVILSGAPLSTGQNLDAVLESKRLELQQLSNDWSSCHHTTVYMLRYVLTAPRLMLLLITAPCTSSPELPKFDTVLRESVSTTLQ